MRSINNQNIIANNNRENPSRFQQSSESIIHAEKNKNQPFPLKNDKNFIRSTSKDSTDRIEKNSNENDIKYLMDEFHIMQEKVYSLELQNKKLIQDSKNPKKKKKNDDDDFAEDNVSNGKFDLNRYIGVYEGMDEVIKVDKKLTQFIDHQTIMNKRLEMEIAQRLGKSMMAGDDYDLDSDPRRDNRKTGDMKKHVKVIDQSIQKERQLVKGFENMSEIEILSENHNVLKRDVASLTELHKILLTVRTHELLTLQLFFGLTFCRNQKNSNKNRSRKILSTDMAKLAVVAENNQ